MKIIGKATIHPFYFYTGKISGYITWILFIFAVLYFPELKFNQTTWLNYFSYSIFCMGCIFIITSIIFLGKSTRLGLPDKKTNFKMSGIYKISRNPMYIGFNLLTISSILLTLNIVVTILGFYSIIIYHFIIKNEEKYLLEEFSSEYEKYLKKVRRYL